MFITSDQAWYLKHRQPQCAKCGSEIARCGFSGDPEIIEGFYTEYHNHMHFHCYDELQLERLKELRKREERIIARMDDVSPGYGLYLCKGYQFFSPTSYKQCAYCLGLISDASPGVWYQAVSSDEIDYLHIACYQQIRSKPRPQPPEDESMAESLVSASSSTTSLEEEKAENQ
jgi:hypothetical protein